MLHQIEAMREVSKPSQEIELHLSKRSVSYGAAAELRVTIRNVSNEPVDVRRRYFFLGITVHRRGTTPTGRVVRDEIYDCFNNPYDDRQANLHFLRATTSVKLLTETGDISMADGQPLLYIQKQGERKRAGLHDEIKTAVAPGETATSAYMIGQGWLANEYELQARYSLAGERELQYVLSQPISFDVTRE